MNLSLHFQNTNLTVAPFKTKTAQLTNYKKSIRKQGKRKSCIFPLFLERMKWWYFYTQNIVPNKKHFKKSSDVATPKTQLLVMYYIYSVLHKVSGEKILVLWLI